jgi:hypothetical protein
MTLDETYDWIAYHSIRIADFGGWWKSQTPGEREAFALAAWAALSHVNPDHAKKFSDRMFAGELPRPFVVSDAVAELCRYWPKPKAKTIGQVEEQKREPLSPEGLTLLQEAIKAGLFKIVIKDEQAVAGVQSRDSMRKVDCPLCMANDAIVMNDVGFCLHCVCRFDPDPKAFHKQFSLHQRKLAAAYKARPRRKKANRK